MSRRRTAPTSSVLDVQEFLRAEFRKGARGEADPATGRLLFDCHGLAMAVHRKYGRDLPDVVCDAFDTRAKDRAARGLRPQFTRLERPDPPCIVAFCLDEAWPEAYSHFGTCIGGGLFVHILPRERAKVQVERLDSPLWRKVQGGFWLWSP